MNSDGLTTKNVPDAMRWHFAKHWSHMFQNNSLYSKTYKTQWKKSADILERTIAIPIMVKMTDEEINDIGNKLLKISKKV